VGAVPDLSDQFLCFRVCGRPEVGFRKIAENRSAPSPSRLTRWSACRPISARRRCRAGPWSPEFISYGFFGLLLIWYVIVAAVLFATLKFALSAEVKFNDALCPGHLCQSAGDLEAILATVSLLAGVAGDAFTFQNPVATNPGYFVDPAANPVLYSLSSPLTCFSLWTLILTASVSLMLARSNRYRRSLLCLDGSPPVADWGWLYRCVCLSCDKVIAAPIGLY